MKQPGPIFAMVPASVTRVDCAVQGAAFSLNTSSLVLARDGVAMIHHLDPTTMLALGILMLRAGKSLGGDEAAAMEFLRGAERMEVPPPVVMEAQCDASHAH